MKKLCLIESPIRTASGYGAHSRDISKSLVKFLSPKEWNFIWVPLPWGITPETELNPNDPEDKFILDNLIKSNQLPKSPDLHIQVSIPSEFRKIGNFSIGITAGTETNMASIEFIQGCNKMDLIIVPSKFTKEVLESTRWQRKNQITNAVEEEILLTKPIEVLFEGLNTNIYRKIKDILPSVSNELDKIPEDFCFLAVGHWLKGNFGHDRKDLGMMIKTFLETFKDREEQPALLLKIAGGSFSKVDEEWIRGRIEDIKKMVLPLDGFPNPKLPNIYVLYGSLTDDEMNSLYNHSKVKAMVSFTHGEGFGRPLLEFSITGKPILASKWSGQLDFLSNGHAILLKGKTEKIDSSAVWDHILLENSEWFRVDYDYASIKMDMVFNHPGQFIEMGKRQTKNALNFTMEKMTEKFDNIIKKHYINNSTSIVLPELPKLRKISDINEKKEVKIPDLSNLEGFKNLQKLKFNQHEMPKLPK